MSDLMTNKKITTNMLIAFAIYYNKRFWIVNPENKTYMDIDCYKNEDDNEKDVIVVDIIYKQKNAYGWPQDVEVDDFEKIRNTMFLFDNFDAPLRTISNYKLSEIEEIAKKIGGDLNGKKKQEIYQEILQKILIQ